MWFAQTQPSPVEWLQGGVLGGVVLALIFGWLWARPAVDRLLHDKDRLIEERSRQIDTLTEEVRELRRTVEKLSNDISRGR